MVHIAITLAKNQKLSQIIPAVFLQFMFAERSGRLVSAWSILFGSHMMSAH